MKDHEQSLKLLSIFHYVAAGLLAVCATIPIIHLVIGLFFLNAPDEVFDGDPPPPAVRTLIGILFTVIPTLIILAGWTTAFLTALAGRYLSRRRHHTFCLVSAGVLCMFMPIGTVLGVLTIIVLIQPEVKDAFFKADVPSKHPG
jgi:hypothetical protein